MPHYELGNPLRFYVACGEFETDEEAWKVLSERFNEHYPSRCGRYVTLKKTVMEGQTAGGNETEQQRKLREALEAQAERDRFTKVHIGAY